MAVFGLFALGVGAYSAVQMWKIDGAYSALMEHQTAATMDLKTADGAIEAARAAIGDLEISTTAEGNRAAKAELADGRKLFETSMDQAAAAFPADEAAIQSLKARGLGILDADCANAINMGASATTPAAALASQQAYLAECSPKFPPYVGALFAKAASTTDGVAKADDALTETTKATIAMTFGLILAGLVMVMIGGSFLISAWVVTPLKRLGAIMARLSSGDLRAEVEGRDRGDEVGAMAGAVQVFKDNALKLESAEAAADEQRDLTDAERRRGEQERAAKAAEQAKVVQSIGAGLAQLSDGDVTVRLDQAFADEYEPLRHDFNGAMDKLQRALGAVSAATNGIRSGSGEINRAAEDLSKRTEQQAASLEETAAALDQITATVKRTAEGATHATQVVNRARADGESSGEVVRSAVAAMTAIARSAEQISHIIGVIDEIAFQTNLLALNAGVEAARAGEAGRGFAVVAQEVRGLAQRSAEAAKEIKGLISSSSEEVDQGVRLVGAAGEALQRIIAQVSGINDTVQSIAASAAEQAAGLAQVNTAVNQMDQMTQQNAAMVEQSTAASRNLADEARDLAQLMGGFRTGDRSGAAASAPPSSERYREVPRLRSAAG